MTAFFFLVVLGASAGTPVSGQRPQAPARGTARPHTASPAGAQDFDATLLRYPALASRIVWTTGDGRRESYGQWTVQMKQRIAGFYQELVRDDPNLGIRLPSVSKIDPKSGRAYFTADQAFDVYATHVAHVVCVEAQHLVPWTLVGRPAVELEVLLDSNSYYARILRSSNTQYPPGRWVVLRPSRRVPSPARSARQLGPPMLPGRPPG